MPVSFNVNTAISVIFAATTLACHFTSSCRSPCVYTSPLVQGMHARVRVGAAAVSSYTSEAQTKTKQNSIFY